MQPYKTTPPFFSSQLFSCTLICLMVLSGCGKKDSPRSADNKKTTRLVIAMLPKLKNIAYFDACHQGAKQAAEELDIELIYDGPNEPSGSEQNKFMETWIRQGVDAICVAPNQPLAIKRIVQRAQERGIKILTWDSDAPESGRLLMVNQVDDTRLGQLLMDDLAEQMNQSGQWAVVIASLDASNLNSWRRVAEARAKEQYPDMELVDTIVTREDENVARQKVETLLNKYPDLKGMIAFDSNSVPGAAEAILRSGKTGQVALTGNTTPGKMGPYLEQGVLKSFYLWDPRKLGDLTIRTAVAAVNGKDLQPGTELSGFGPLTFSSKDPTMIILSDPIRFTKDNISEYDWGF